MPRSNTFHRKFNLQCAIATVLSFGAAALPLVYSSAVFAQEDESEDVAELGDITVSDDGMRALSNEPSAASFGFAKPLLETPRTVTFVSEEQLRLFGVSTVEDLSRLVPGTYTTTRYGLQGGINVRGVSADFYYRGMKRLQMQGHVRTVLSAYDNIEVIKGPPSPLYGLGKIGGYANLDPKSNRAKTGKYMTDQQGYLQATLGRYNKNELQFGLGVPFEVAGKTAGIYLVGLLEDSDTYVETVPAKQKFLQATVSVDDVFPGFRLETGGQVQNSITAGGYFTRVTQDLIDNGTYVQGRPMANLDLNGDGRVGYVETYLASPITGNGGGSNQALDQRYAVDLTGVADPRALIASYNNTIQGIPQAMKDYLNGAGSYLSCDMANYMRDTAPVATYSGATPVSREMPIGFALDPCNTGVTTLTDANYRGNGAYEREQNATQRMFYFDLINDSDPDFTFKNQFFYDSLNSFKDSWLPYGENQGIHMFEDKLTVTKVIKGLPDFLAINALGSINYRETSGWIRSSGGDFDYRQDITYNTGESMSGTGGFYPNTMFWTQLTNDSYQSGAVNTRDLRSTYTEKGIGVMFDIDIFENTNVLLGARFDEVNAEARDSPAFNATSSTNIDTSTLSDEFIATWGSFDGFVEAYASGDPSVCASPTEEACPGAYRAESDWVDSKDDGASWSVSVSHKLPWGGLLPYVTKANSTILLDGANNIYTGSLVKDGYLVGEAGLTEFGIKGELFRKKMQWTLASFSQERSDVAGASDPSINAFVSSTKTEGFEASVNWQPTQKLFVGASVVSLTSDYIEGASNLSVDINARELGYQDIVVGDEIYPAEAFAYGGRTRITLTDPDNYYHTVPGTPELQLAMNTTYNLGHGFGILGNVQYFSESWGNRIQTIEIPETTVLNVGATWDSAKVHLKANIYNVTDETYFRATNGGNGNMASVMPDRRWELSMKVDF